MGLPIASAGLLFRRFTAHLDQNWLCPPVTGFSKSPEACIRRVVHRVTRTPRPKLGQEGQIVTSLIWGANRAAGRTTHSRYGLKRCWSRRTYDPGTPGAVQKTAEDLVCRRTGGFAPDSTFTCPCRSDTFAKWFGCRTQRSHRIPGNAGPDAERAAAVLRITDSGGRNVLRAVHPLHTPHRLQ